MKYLLSIVTATVLIGCGSGDSASAKLELGYGDTLTAENAEEIYIQDGNETQIIQIQDGYDYSFGSDGSILITKVDDATISGNYNTVVNCSGGSCPVDIKFDSDNQTEEPTVVVVEQPEPIVVDNNYTEIINENTSTIIDSNSSL
jgi:sorbitol-specific phosphotransferase system component IIA